MLIILDTREQQLIQECRRYLSGKKELESIKLEIKTLDIGDIIVCDDTSKEVAIIERKTMKDLASSIRDGRYQEQGYRLDNCTMHNHNIYYLIEGTLGSLGPRFERKTVLSSIASISYHKGFSLYRTMSVAESAEWLIRFADKLRRTEKPPYYTNQPSVISKQEDNEDNKSEYTSVCKRVKKNNITYENISAIMLMQIPGVSPESAKTIMQSYGTLKQLIDTLTENPKDLDKIKQKTKTGKERNINKTTKANIYNYLVTNKSGDISVQTE
tara:strand:- start:1525 stop:2334 length:810 start_codon:yes stop_codon:yes gene_type:complete